MIPGSLTERAVPRIIEGKDVRLLSPEILGELLSVIATKFSRDKKEISRVAVILVEMAEWIESDLRVSASKDDGFVKSRIPYSVPVSTSDLKDPRSARTEYQWVTPFALSADPLGPTSKGERDFLRVHQR